MFLCFSIGLRLVCLRSLLVCLMCPLPPFHAHRYCYLCLREVCVWLSVCFFVCLWSCLSVFVFYAIINVFVYTLCLLVGWLVAWFVRCLFVCFVPLLAACSLWLFFRCPFLKANSLVRRHGHRKGNSDTKVGGHRPTQSGGEGQRRFCFVLSWFVRLSCLCCSLCS